MSILKLNKANSQTLPSPKDQNVFLLNSKEQALWLLWVRVCLASHWTAFSISVGRTWLDVNKPVPLVVFVETSGKTNDL